MKKRALIAAAAVAATLTLAGCATGGSPSSDSRAGKTDTYLYERSIVLKDGRTVDCVELWAAAKGGVSCDWANAKAATR